MHLVAGWGIKAGAVISAEKSIRAGESLSAGEAIRAGNGYGVACLPTYVVADDILSGKLQVVLPDYRSAITHTLYAMYFRSKYTNPTIRGFIDFIADDLGSIPPWDAALRAHLPFLIDE